MTALPISVCMISGPEVRRIARALQSVRGWTAEIIVVLNDDVHDGTAEVASDLGASVFREPWKGHIAQKNSAAARATQPWLLGLDADEVISDGLRAAIAEAFSDPPQLQLSAAFTCPRITHYCGRWIRHGDWYPDWQTRLWRRGMAEWDGIDPHDKLRVRGRVRCLRGDLLHYSAEDINRQVAKITAFGDDFARHALGTGRRVGWCDLAFRPFWRFFRGYVLRLGFLDGWQGYHIAWMTAFHTVNRYAKVLEARQTRRLGTSSGGSDSHG